MTTTMNQLQQTDSNQEPVSTVVKHIKIYSDNPIHDCIDRIIDACVALDEGQGDNFFHAMALHMAANKLIFFATDRLISEGNKINNQTNAKRPN